MARLPAPGVVGPDWNTPSIAFYQATGAVAMDEWTVFRLTDDALTDFAAARRPR